MHLFNMFSRRNSLSALSRLDDRRLSDLGLNRYDLFDAGNCRDAAILLADRRNERAFNWLR